MSLHLVKQASEINNEANLERFHTAQEISNEIISGKQSSRRNTVDPAMLSNTDNASSENEKNSFKYLNINLESGSNSKKIEFNPNSLGLN